MHVFTCRVLVTFNLRFLYLVGFTPFYRQRRPLGRIEVQLYSVFRPRH
jgi:hypothetical protein